MASRLRIPRLLVLVLALALAPTPLARANPAYDRVSAAFAQGGGTLDGCAFTQTELQSALASIPKAVAKFIPDLRKAIRGGIALHEHGACKGRTPGKSIAPVSPAGGVSPPQTTTPANPATGQLPPTASTGTTIPAPPDATVPAPSATAPAQPLVTSAARHRDRTAVAVALIALGALLLLALLLWGWARLRGWDPAWGARARHAWGEAGYRTTTTWSEFTDWLRLGR